MKLVKHTWITIYIGILLKSYQMAHWLIIENAMWLRRYWAIIWNLSGTALYLSQTCNQCHQAGPHCLVDTILDWFKPSYCLWAWQSGRISDLLFTQRVTLRRLVIWVSWMCDRLGNFNRAGCWIMQSCFADNINNNDKYNVSPIWRRLLIFFRQIENRFAYGANGDRQR